MVHARLTLRYLQPTLNRTATTRAFSSSPSHNRLGAALYSQEWQTGSYHFNKAHSKLEPTALIQTDRLLQQYATAQAKKQTKLVTKAATNAHRSTTDKWYVSKAMAKDFGGKVVVEAYMFDGKEQADSSKGRGGGAGAARGGRGGARGGARGGRGGKPS